MTEYIIQETINFNETRRVMTDDEVCEQLQHHIVFSAPKAPARADGETPFKVEIQIVSQPLSDETRRPIAGKRNIVIVGDEGETFTVETDEQGHGTFECAFAAAGKYHFNTDGVIYSEGITIEAI